VVRNVITAAGEHRRQIGWAINGALLLVVLPTALSYVVAEKERAAKERWRRRRVQEAEDRAVFASVRLLRMGAVHTFIVSFVDRLLNHRREQNGLPRLSTEQLAVISAKAQALP